MRARVLGSAAGGGFPQWNCGCAGCIAAREGRATPRTQDSIAIDTGEGFLLVNASPDIHRQIQASPFLWPKRPRHTPIAGIVLTNGDLDHVLGLFSLRESQPLVLYATEAVLRGLEENAMMRTLRRFPEQLAVRRLSLGEPIAITGEGGAATSIEMTAIAAPGKPPIHASRNEPSLEDNVALVIRDARARKTIAYVSSVAGPGAWQAAIEDADVLLLDGTFFTSDELIREKLGTSRAEDMAHWPIGGEAGSLAAFRTFRGRGVYTHINNTNPILREASPERRRVEEAGFEIAFDGMSLEP